jgi:hypothetical protein
LTLRAERPFAVQAAQEPLDVRRRDLGDAAVAERLHDPRHPMPAHVRPRTWVGEHRVVVP